MVTYSKYDSFCEYIPMFNNAVEDDNYVDAIRIGRKIVQLADDECKRPDINVTMKKTYSENSQRAREYLADMRVNTLGGQISAKKPEVKAQKWFSDKVPSYTLRDYKGNQEVKNAFIVNVLAPLSEKYSTIFQKFRGFMLIAQILLFGPPGTGKTFAVMCLAGTLKCHIAVVQLSVVLSKYVGEAPKIIDEIFEEARQYDRCIIFFDEFDAFAANRDDDEARYTKDVLTAILTNMDGFSSKVKEGQLRIIIAATNRPWSLDPSVKRGGRFDTQIYVPVPDYDARLQLTKLALGKDESIKGRVDVPCGTGVTIEWLAEVFEGMSGADINAICMQIVNRPLLREITSHMNDGAQEDEVVTREDCEVVLANYINVITDGMLLQYDAYLAGLELIDYIRILKKRAAQNRESVPAHALRYIENV
jgi:SpoVK/Ycf46/Vps4 family AAA+-type ATPase